MIKLRPTLPREFHLSHCRLLVLVPVLLHLRTKRCRLSSYRAQRFRRRVDRNNEGQYPLTRPPVGGREYADLRINDPSTSRLLQMSAQPELFVAPVSELGAPRSAALCMDAAPAETARCSRQESVSVPVPASISTPSNGEIANEVGESEDHKCCMNTANCNLQVLNITIPVAGAEKTNTAATKRNEFVLPLPSIGKGPDGQPVTTVGETSPPPATEAQTQEQNHSALLVAQLVEIADGVVDGSASADDADVLETGSDVVWI